MIDRAELSAAVSEGRAVRKPHLAPLVWREAQRHKVAGRVTAAVCPLLLAASTAGMSYLVEGQVRSFAAVLGAVGGLLVGAPLLVITSRNARRTVDRNAVLLEGLDPADAVTTDSRGYRALRRVGYWVAAFFIVSFLLRVSVGFVATLLALAGLDLTAVPETVTLAVSIPLLAWLTWRTQRYLREEMKKGTDM